MERSSSRSSSSLDVDAAYQALVSTAETPLLSSTSCRLAAASTRVRPSRTRSVLSSPGAPSIPWTAPAIIKPCATGTSTHSQEKMCVPTTPASWPVRSSCWGWDCRATHQVAQWLGLAGSGAAHDLTITGTSRTKQRREKKQKRTTTSWHVTEEAEPAAHSEPVEPNADAEYGEA
eukprot:5872987-Amphidinium_carterae.1